MNRIKALLGICALAAAPALFAEGDAEAGQELFDAKCSVCHNTDSKEKKIGPGLAGVKDGKLPSEKDATDENILENLNLGGNGMPPFEKLLSDEEKADLTAYVQTL